MPLSLLIFAESLREGGTSRTTIHCRTPFQRVSEVASAAEANQQLGEFHFDGAVVDLDADGGDEVLRAIRQDSTHRHIPIVGLSQESQGPGVERLLAGALDSVVSKPVEPDVLRDELRYIAGSRPRRSRR